MMYGGGNTPFTVIYSDGDRENNLGSIVVDPSMNFRRFITLLSQRVGIPPRHLSVFLTAAGSDRKIPITTKVNLASIAGYGNSHYFFVKPSRKFRKCLTSSNKNPPQNVVLLRREAAASSSGGVDATAGVTMMAPPQHPPIPDGIDYRRSLINFMSSQTVNDHHGGGGGAVCEVCLTGNDSDFHLCVHDEVIEGFFRSTVGPISRPARNSDEYYCWGWWFSFMEAWEENRTWKVNGGSDHVRYGIR
ncbi:hypothetical protein SESBI_47816 [Sesbania bispinosa]|nr:hypothetical protein SESBI_47816 [Sesbania bispinosa]